MSTDSILALRLDRSARKSSWFAKDRAKAARATRFIGRGSPRSSTEAYRQAAGDLANPGIYTAANVVFVSAEGNRSGRLAADWAELARAIAGGATLITDIAADRERPYNVGEREVARYLTDNGYREAKPGLWKPAVPTCPREPLAK